MTPLMHLSEVSEEIEAIARIIRVELIADAVEHFQLLISVSAESFPC